MKKIILLLLITVAFHLQAQQIFTENFADTSAKALTASGWTQIVGGGPGGGANPITINSFGLNYPGYILSGVGNSVSLRTSGQDVYKATEQTANNGSVYMAFMLSDSAALSGNYFLGFLPTNNTNTISGRVYVKAASAGYYKIGISKYTETPAYSTDSFAMNTTQLFVLKYKIITGTLNDSVYLYAINGAMPTSEPTTPTLVSASSNVADIASIGRVVISQVAAASSPSVTVDGIRVSKDWAGLLAPTHIIPNPATNLVLTPLTFTTENVSWTASKAYVDSTMTYLVFAKLNTNITTNGNLTWPLSAYNANSNFSLATSKFQLDTAAKCVYKGDSLSFVLSGLTQNTRYTYAVYAVHDMDSLYSTALTGTGTSMSSAPNPVTGLTFTATGPGKAHISWNIPNAYNPAQHTILVFMKPTTTIRNVGRPTQNPNKYFTDTIFPGNASKYQNDTAARCIYKGDSNFVDVKGLAYSTNYYLLAYAVNDADSNYSTQATANGLSNSNGPISLQKATFTVGSGTGQLHLSWQKDASYDSTTSTILVYLKRANPITNPNNNKSLNPLNITADATMSGLGTKLPTDTGAYCVYKGDGNFVDISGLQATSTYNAALFVVRDADTACSNAITASGTTRPAKVNNLRWSSNSPITGTVNWNAPTGYTNPNFSTLVFIKKDSLINSAIPDLAPRRYTANTTFGNGTKYQFDTGAYCIGNADNGPININGLTYQSTYYISVWVVHDADSVYSLEATIKGRTAPNPMRAPMTFTATGPKRAHITWNAPNGYDAATQTMLVFIKANANITPGATRTLNPSNYNADTIVPGNASKFQNDTAAYCIYNGDSTFVDVTGLAYSTNYFLLGYVVNNADSNYSTGLTATGVSNSAGPLGLLKPVITAGPVGQLHLAWQKPSGYNANTETILVYLKKTTAITNTIANKYVNPANVYADTAMSGAGTKLGSDTAAFCVYKGDSNSVDVSGLTPNTTYYAVFYALTDVDTAMSNPITASGFTRSTAVTNLKWSSTTATNGVITWTNPTGYTNINFTTLVFIKKGSPINAGDPNNRANIYTANAAYGLGTKYVNDTNAYCVLRGTQTTVTITGLSNQSLYYVSVFVVHNTDSMYSPEAFVSGTPLPPPPFYMIGQVNHTNMSTGNPDSLNVRATLRGVVYGFNQGTTGLRFIMRDPSGGIAVVNTTKTFGYTVKQSDSVEVQGTITVQRGLTEIANLDTLILINTGNAIKTPTYLTSKLDETNESDLVRLDSLRFITAPVGNWPSNGTVNCYIRNTTDTVVIRLFNTSGLAGKPLPSAKYFSVQGLVVQNSTSPAAPFAFNGYQMIPRDTNDVFIVKDTLFPSMNFTATGPTTAHISWTKPVNYSNTSMNTLIYIKQAGNPNNANNLKALYPIIDNLNWAQKGSMLVNDSNAFCMYNGDSTQIDVKGLSANTTYYVMAVVKTVNDSILHYSSYVKGTTTSTAPFPIQSLSFIASGVGTAHISWTKPKYFIDTAHTIVVFMKPIDSVITGSIRSTNPIHIQADTFYPGSASTFQNDPLAFCVYKGIGTSVDVSNLLYSTNYYLVAYAINKADSNYSSGIIASGISNSNGPVAVTQLSFRAQRSGVAKISWKKDVTYRNQQFTTVVYLKKSTGISTSSLILPGIKSIFADSVFGNGSKYANDTAAYCVYKGDSLYTLISNLSPGSNYYALVYVIRDLDSAYSNGTTVSGITPLNPATNFKISGTSLNSATISWTPPTGYNAANYSTLVFLKADSTILGNTPEMNTSNFYGSIIYGNGSTSSSDAKAYCVFNGDGNSVSVYGINYKHQYYAQIYIVHDADSLYSTEAITSGSTLGLAPYYAIASINHVNSTSGVPDSLNAKVRIRGIVYGFNQNQTGYKFTIRDNSGGIVILNSSIGLPYVVNEGDSLEIQGTVTVNRGLTELSSLDTVLVLANNKTLKKPTILSSKLSEYNESDLVQYNELVFINRPTSGTWQVGSSINCYIKNTMDTVSIRVLSTSGIAGMPLPNGQSFSCVGIVTQTSTSAIAPFAFNGYQLMPRDLNDINSIYDTLTPFDLISPSNNSLVELGGDTNQVLRFNWYRSQTNFGVSNPIYSVLIMDDPNNITQPIFIMDANQLGLDSNLSIKYNTLAKDLNLAWGTQTNWYWTVVAQSGTVQKYAGSVNMITFKRSTFTSIATIEPELNFEIYPNPSNSIVRVIGNNSIDNIEIYNLMGQQIIQTANPTIHVESLNNGVYMVKIYSGNKVQTKRLVVE